MSIAFDRAAQTFTLETDRTAYQMKLDGLGHLLHVYYGRRTGDAMDYLLPLCGCGFSPEPHECPLPGTASLDVVPQEYSAPNTGDYRLSSVESFTGSGIWGADLRSAGFRILPGKYRVRGMPSAMAGDADVQTLSVTLADAASGLEAELLYAVFPGNDVITRAVRLTNRGTEDIVLRKAASACLDLPCGEWDLIHFHGRHTMERQPERRRLMRGIETAGSTRGASSHQHNPFVILCSPETSEDSGDCFGLMLVYSGSHRTDIEVDQLGLTRVVTGIQSDLFQWTLKPGETFDTPEVLLSFSPDGLTGLSRNFHRMIRDHICRSRWTKMRRPVLINTWEAAFFDFTAGEILEIAREARDLGVEMLVLDDGWFGSRDSDRSGLGDWTASERKLPGGLGPLAEGIRDLGMLFGLWVEPEMVNEDSDLFRAHPDWVLSVPGRSPALARSQLVLDLSRRDVEDWLYDTLAGLLKEYPISYIKWDMNRHMSDVYSRLLPAERQGETAHRCMLGLYSLLERLTSAFPDVLFEGCSGGGGRFDAAMLSFCPQIWCSDDTDAIERLSIQTGTSFGYPVSSMGAHVSAVPNQQTGRTVPFGTRAVVAMTGAFGYELDPRLLTGEEKAQVRTQIQRFHEYSDVIQNGDFYRLGHWEDGGSFTAWQMVSPDRGESLVSLVLVRPRPNLGPLRLRLKGLDPEGIYRVVRQECFGARTAGPGMEGRVLSGAALMYGGCILPDLFGSFPSVQIYLKRENIRGDSHG